MLYKFIEDYDDLIIQEINTIQHCEQNECFICFEFQKVKEIPNKLKNQTIFLKFCSCDGWIHDSCLKTWFNINEKCPICRTIMLENNLLELEYGFYMYYYFYFIKKIINKFIMIIIRFKNIFIFCIIISNIINIFCNCFKYYDYDIYEYTFDYCFPSDNYYIESSQNILIQ
jgi:hypothetical protein